MSPDKLFFTVRHIPTWMPGAGFKRHALRTRVKVRTMHDTPYEMVRKATVSHGSPINPPLLILCQGGRHSHSLLHIEAYFGQSSCWKVAYTRRRGYQGGSRNVVWRCLVSISCSGLLDAHTSHTSHFHSAAADTVGVQFIIGCNALAETSCFSRRPQRLLHSFWP
jgi:hypothetical protein